MRKNFLFMNLFMTISWPTLLVGLLLTCACFALPYLGAPSQADALTKTTIVQSNSLQDPSEFQKKQPGASDHQRLAELQTQATALKEDAQRLGQPNWQETYDHLIAEIQTIEDRLRSTDHTVHSRLAPKASLTFNGSITNTDPTFTRPNAFSFGNSCSASATGRFWDAYEMNTACSALVTASMFATEGGFGNFDSYLIIYQAPGGAQIPGFAPNGCTNALAANDDTCGTQSRLVDVPVVAGYYYVVVASFGTTDFGSYTLAVNDVCYTPQMNDTCASAVALALNTPVIGTTYGATNDYQLSGSGCFTGIGQTPTTASGRDVVYRFTAPATGNYSFRVTGYNTANNLVI